MDRKDQANYMEEINLIAQYDAKSPIAEAYKAIRTNLQFASVGTAARVITFTSATPEEGKSTTISNVALTMAQDGKKTLLIDADMRKPVQHRIFGIPNQGLSNCIAMDVSWEDTVQHDVVPRLDVLTSGPVPPNPSELLGSARMQQIVSQVRTQYDYVLIDMPPVLAVTDAVVMASKADGVVFVVKSGSISPEEAKMAKTKLEQGGAHILGVVLNEVPRRQHGSYGYEYYYYYDEEHVKHKEHHRKQN
jgi:capsular exopolysaccharide synthesis family protein